MLAYCISLKNNVEAQRLAQIEFDKLNLEVNFELVDKHLNGEHGCFLSHQQVLRKCLSSNYDYYFIFEDDVYFESYDLTEIYELMKSLTGNFCITLGYFTSQSARKYNNFVTFTNCQCTHAYIVPRSTAEKLVKLEYLEPYDFAWNKVIDKFYAPNPMIAFQRDHKSSVSDGVLRKVINFFSFRTCSKFIEWYVTTGWIKIFSFL